MSHFSFRNRVAIGVCSTAILAAAGLASADPASTTASTTAGPVQQSTLEEVVVTARKREEKLLDVPSPVSAISAEQLQVTQAVRLEDYLTQVPGVTFDDQRAGQTKVTFRGINAGDSDATVVTYVDNAPLTPSAPNANSAYVTPSFDPSDLAQIEVDRGPQGTLYGANAIGGVLKYVTVKPDPNTFSGRFEVSGESADNGGLGGTVRGAVNVPLISDTLGLRVSGFTRKDPGYIDDPLLGLKDVNSNRVYGGRAALRWIVNSDVTVDLSSMIQLMRNDGNDNVDINPLTGQPQYGGLTHERSWRNEFFSSRNAIYNADVQWDLHWATLISSTSFSTLSNGADNDVSPAYTSLLEGALGVTGIGLDNPLEVHGKQVTEELRLTSSGKDKFEWQVGGFFTHDQTKYDQSANLFNVATQTYDNDFGPMFQGYLRNQYIERSGFGNVDYHFTDQFDLGLGARYSADSQKLDSFFQGLIFGPTADVQNVESEHALTWSVDPRFKINEDEMVYARVATGYRPGGVTFLIPSATAAGLSPTFKPDHLTNYEIGWKSAMFDRRFTVDISVYYIRWTDVQENITLGPFTYGANAGLAHSQGVETAFTWAPLAGLNLTANLTYNDNRLDADAQTNPDLSQAGNRLPDTPKFNGNFAADYKWAVTPQLNAFAGGSVFFTTARPSGLALAYNPNNASGEGAMNNFGLAQLYNPTTGAPAGFVNTAMPGYTTIDLHAGVERGPWSVEAFVKNLTDRHAFTEYSGLNNASYGNLASIWTATMLPPRIVGLSLVRKF
jgi:iron complex outermembrane recepter protein